MSRLFPGRATISMLHRRIYKYIYIFHKLHLIMKELHEHFLVGNLHHINQNHNATSQETEGKKCHVVFIEKQWGLKES